ncbi:MAG: hypothetical protein M3P98_02770 [bacterium]|nr:hypothetical protein [bacterium]
MSNPFQVIPGEALSPGKSRFTGVPTTDGNTFHMLPKANVTPKLRVWNSETVIKYCGSEYDSEIAAGARMFGDTEDLDAALGETIDHIIDQLSLLDSVQVDYAQPHYEIGDVPKFAEGGKIEKLEKGIIVKTQIIRGVPMGDWVNAEGEHVADAVLGNLYDSLAQYVALTKGRMFLPNIFEHVNWRVSGDEDTHFPTLTSLEPNISFNQGELRESAIETIKRKGMTLPHEEPVAEYDVDAIILAFPMDRIGTS